MGQPVACAIGPDTGPDEEVRLAPSPNKIRADFRLLKVKGVISSFPISSQRCNFKFPNLVRLETGNMELTLRVWDSYLRNLIPMAGQSIQLNKSWPKFLVRETREKSERIVLPLA